MAGGSPLWGSNRFTLYTPYVSKIIQNFLESKAIWDPSSSTGFRKYNPMSRQMEEFTNNDNGQNVPLKWTSNHDDEVYRRELLSL
jgi:hypothetical protein